MAEASTTDDAAATPAVGPPPAPPPTKPTKPPTKPPVKPPEGDASSAGAKPTNHGITTAVGLGWQMAEVFREVGLRTIDATGLPPTLPGISAFPATHLWKLRLDQVDVALARLETPVRRAVVGTKVALPSVAALRTLNARVEEARWAVLQLHRDTLDVLTAANFRLGKAYGLGVSLADLTLEPPADERWLRASLAGGGLADTIVAGFDDLTSVLPPHVAQSVSGSVREWQGWALARRPGTPTDWSEVAGTLKRQGRRWRSILTGEKSPKDLLGIDDYLLAGEAMFARFRRLTTRFLLQHWIGVLTAMVVIAGVVLLALIFAKGTAKFWTVSMWLFGSVGVSGATVRTSVGKAKGQIGDSLWGAELDMAVIKAVTTLPGNAPASIAPPPVSMAGSNKAYRKVPTGPPTRPVDEETMKLWGPQRTGQVGS